MEDKEKATPVTPDEIEDIRVTLDLDEGEVECKILTIFEVNKQDYIALMPLNPDGSDPDEGTVYLYRYAEVCISLSTTKQLSSFSASNVKVVHSP